MFDRPTTSPAEVLGTTERHGLAHDFERLFRFIVWNVPSMMNGVNAECGSDLLDTAVVLDELLGLGTRVAIIMKSDLMGWSQVIDRICHRHRRKLFFVDENDAAVFGFDHHGAAIEIVRHAFSGRTQAMKLLLDHEIHPLAIDPSEMLVLNGLSEDRATLPDADAGVDLQWLPGCAGAISLSCELAQTSAILRRQKAFEERLGPFAPPIDAAWTIVESGFDVTREHEIESILAIANGYVGVRGSIAEGSEVSRPATFLAGRFEQSADVAPVPELVIAPDWGRLRFMIDNELFSASSSTMQNHHRTLDLRRGVLLREGMATGSGGHTTAIRTLHAASFASRHLLLEFVEIVPKNFSGTIVIDAILSGDVKSESGGTHWNRFEARDSERGPMLIGTTHGGLQLALSSRTHAVGYDNPILTRKREFGPTWATERCELHLRIGEPSELHRVVGMYSSSDDGDPVTRAVTLDQEYASAPSAALLEEHAAAWAERWCRANIEIDGAPKIEKALRFGMYHLLGAVHPTDSRTSIGARALSGQAYRGHVFWDTEIFMLPFFQHVWPEAARTLLRYRYRTLPGARRKAQNLHYQGALYAWESADTGDETTPTVVLNPFGEIIPILSGLEEHHISADIAYAVWSYLRASGEEGTFVQEGAEILFETARFWKSRVQRKRDEMFHIERVIGPDEYHESVDDNAFTNFMARKNLIVAAEMARNAGHAVASSLGITAEEITQWEHIAQHMYLGIDERSLVIEQHRGFFGLEHIDLEAFARRTAPMDVLLGRERTQASQVVKQADVVQLIALLWDEIGPQVRRKSFLYYEPRTAHGSSLSPGIHAWVAARLGLLDLAAHYLEQTAEIDLGNTMGNSSGGIHAAAMGSLWQAVVFGVAGLRQDPEDPKRVFVEPNLLPGMRHLSLPVTIRGCFLTLHICRDAIELLVHEGPAPIELIVQGPAAALVSVRAEPGRAYVSKRVSEGFLPWEETNA